MQSSHLNKASNLPSKLFEEKNSKLTNPGGNKIVTDRETTDFHSSANFHEELPRAPMPSIDDPCLEVSSEAVSTSLTLSFCNDETTAKNEVCLLDYASSIEAMETPPPKEELYSLPPLDIDDVLNTFTEFEKRDPIPQINPHDLLPPIQPSQSPTLPCSSSFKSPSKEVYAARRLTTPEGNMLHTKPQSVLTGFSSQNIANGSLSKSEKELHISQTALSNEPLPTRTNKTAEKYCTNGKKKFLAILNSIKREAKEFSPKRELAASASTNLSVGQLTSVREASNLDNVCLLESRKRTMQHASNPSKRKRLSPERALSMYASYVFQRLNPKEFTSGTTVAIALLEAIRKEKAEKVEGINNTWQVKETASKSVARDWAKWVGSAGKALDPWPNFSAKIRNSISHEENLFEKPPKNDGFTPVNRCFTFGSMVVNLINNGTINVSPTSDSTRVRHTSLSSEPNPKADDSTFLPPNSN